MKKIYILSWVLCLFVITSCVTPQYVNNITSHQSLKQIQKKSTTVVGLDRVFIQSYEKTFHKNFQNKLEFSHRLADDMAHQLGATGVFSEAIVDFSSDWNHINTMTSKKSYLKIQSLFDECKTDYLICIDDFQLKQRLTVTNNNLGDPNNMSVNNMSVNNNSTSSEFIRLEAKIKIFDVATHEPVLEFDVFSEDQIMFFSYSKSLQDVREKLVDETVAFLKKQR
ncbi:hypothetical protein [Flavicella marina]|uniref:hypothetical protein n=1 Tax=Flavicella marina TaxID=1475951 RepID=UPI001264441C|nr:hypothetical protein [Flavicella marina]